MSTLLEELRAPIAAAQVERRGRTWPAPQEYWKAALEQMVGLRDQAKLQLPLKSHGYLLEVIVGMSEKAESRAEGEREGQRAGHAAHAPQSFKLFEKKTADNVTVVAEIPAPLRKQFVKGRRQA